MIFWFALPVAFAVLWLMDHDYQDPQIDLILVRAHLAEQAKRWEPKSLHDDDPCR